MSLKDELEKAFREAGKALPKVGESAHDSDGSKNKPTGTKSRPNASGRDKDQSGRADGPGKKRRRKGPRKSQDGAKLPGVRKTPKPPAPSLHSLMAAKSRNTEVASDEPEARSEPYSLRIKPTARPYWKSRDCQGHSSEPGLLPVGKAKVRGTNSAGGVRELVIGLDLGTSFAKVVVADRALGRAMAVPFRDADGIDRYMLPTRLVAGENGFSLSGSGDAYTNIKMDLLQNPDDAESRVRATAFLTLVLIRVRSWIFQVSGGAYRSMDIVWSVGVGLPSREQDEKAGVYELIAEAAWYMSEEPEKEITAARTKTALEKVSKSEEAQSEGQVCDVEIRIVPEIGAQVYGYVASDRFNARDRNLFLMADVGAGTLDAAVFQVKRDRGRVNFCFYATTVEPNGVANLHLSRLRWWEEVLDQLGDGAPNDLRSEISSVRGEGRPTQRIPERIQEYVVGAEVGFNDPNADPDANFYRNVDTQIRGRTLWQSWSDGHWSQDDLKGIPFYLCGGGSRLELYGALRDSLREYRGYSWLNCEPKRLVVPESLEAPGLGPDDYDRLSVAYGLSFANVGRVERPEPGEKILMRAEGSWRDRYEEYTEK